MKREILLGLMAGVISFTSCDVDLLDIPQQGVTNEEAFYKTDQDCEEAIAAVYRSWRIFWQMILIQEVHDQTRLMHRKYLKVQPCLLMAG